MADEALYYKTSGDYEEHKAGIEVVVATTPDQLIKAGVTAKDATTLMSHLNPDPYRRLLVVRDQDGAPTRIFSGEYQYGVSNTNGPNIPSSIHLQYTVDLKDPNKVVRMDKEITLQNVREEGRALTTEQVDTIQSAIDKKQIGQLQGIYGGIDVTEIAPPLPAIAAKGKVASIG